MGTDSVSVYFAGALFDHKDLLGNAVLADKIREVSGGRYRCVLPQNLQGEDCGAKRVRDADILELLSCDAALFGFDGSELDSGTVVEFMFAKFADIPAVVLRTDFRGGGDCENAGAGEGGAFPWNLMAAFYPRTETVLADAGRMYRSHLGGAGEPGGAADGIAAAFRAAEELAETVVGALEKAVGAPPEMPARLRAGVYEWLGRMPGFADASAPGKILAALERKIAKKIL